MEIKEISIKNSTIDKSVILVSPVNIYGATIKKNCFIGPFCEIQNNVLIDKNTRIQSHSFICEKVSIGKNCFIGHGVIFVNDKFSEGQRANGVQNKILPTFLGDNVFIGSNATILPVEICENVTIGAGSVVVKDIVEPGIYAGNPAIKIK